MVSNFYRFIQFLIIELQDWKIRIDANRDIIANLEESLKDLHEKNLEMKQDYIRLNDLLSTGSN